MYGGASRLGKSYGKNRETFNVNGAREVKLTAVRAGQQMTQQLSLHSSPRRPPLKPAPEDRRNRRPKANTNTTATTTTKPAVTKGASRNPKKSTAEPTESRSVHKASVVSTHGSGAENDDGKVGTTLVLWGRLGDF